MTKETSKSAVVTDSPSATESVHDSDDIFEEGDLLVLPDGIDKETIRRDARRKIEIYWEKKRLKEQFEDFDESEFGF